MHNLSPFDNGVIRNTVPSANDNIGIDDSVDCEFANGKLDCFAPSVSRNM